MGDSNGFSAVRRTIPSDLAAPYVGRPIAGTGVQGPAAPNVDRSLQVWQPEIFPIPGAQEFNNTVNKSTVAPETNTDFGLSIQLPPYNIGIIRSVSIYITNMLATTNVTYTLNINNAPVGGYSGLSIFPRVAPSISNSFDSFIRVPQGAKITASFTNTDGGTYVVGFAVSGWFWPQEIGNQWIRQGPQL